MLFRKDIEPRCAYCARGNRINDEVLEFGFREFAVLFGIFLNRLVDEVGELALSEFGGLLLARIKEMLAEVFSSGAQERFRGRITNRMLCEHRINELHETFIGFNGPGPGGHNVFLPK